MTEQTLFTIEQMCKSMSQGKLLAAKCKKCGKLLLPPRPLCDECFSNEFEPKEISPLGRLLTYTVIHIAPVQFQAAAPYAVGIVQLENNTRIPGMIKNLPLDRISIGLNLKVVFEACSTAGQWPQWPRYHFEPTQ
jgi:uncharacterized OB-fold protein